MRSILKYAQCGKLLHGFTLVELLVVISIIALLLSILMPTLQKAREQAKKAICASNFHQIGTVHQAYASSYGCWLPRLAAISGGGVDYDFKIPIGATVQAVMPYVISKKLFDYLESSYGTSATFWVCPFLRSKSLVNGKLGEWAGGQCYGLGVAQLVGMANMTSGSPSNVKDSALSPMDRSNKILAADVTVRWNNDWLDPATLIAHKGRLYEGVRYPAGANRVHVDGSVDWNKPESMALDGQSVFRHPRIPGKYDHTPSLGRDYFW